MEAILVEDTEPSLTVHLDYTLPAGLFKAWDGDGNYLGVLSLGQELPSYVRLVHVAIEDWKRAIDATHPTRCWMQQEAK
jgi:hypothetical protein